MKEIKLTIHEAIKNHGVSLLIKGIETTEERPDGYENFIAVPLSIDELTARSYQDRASIDQHLVTGATICLHNAALRIIRENRDSLDGPERIVPAIDPSLCETDTKTTNVMHTDTIRHNGGCLYHSEKEIVLYLRKSTGSASDKEKR